MATMCCPHCQKHFQKPTNVVAWVVGIVAALIAGGFLLIIICLAAVTAIGANANAEDAALSSNASRLQVRASAPSHQPRRRLQADRTNNGGSPE